MSIAPAAANRTLTRRQERAQILLRARRVGRAVAKITRIMSKLATEVSADLKSAGLGESSWRGSGHKIEEAENNISNYLQDLFNSELDTYARHTWREYDTARGKRADVCTARR